MNVFSILKRAMSSVSLLLVCLFYYTTLSAQTISFISSQPSGCYPLTITFTNTSTGGSCYYWSFGDGNNYTGTDTSHTYTYAGNFTVTLYSYSDSLCSNYLGSYTQQIIAYDTTGNINIGKGYYCPNEEVYLSFTGYTQSYDWFFGDSTTYSGSQSAAHTYTSLGTKNISVIYNTGCKTDTALAIIDIVDTVSTTLLSGDWGVDYNDTIYCPGENASFYFYSGSYPSHTFTWYFGDGDSSTQSFPKHSYDTSGVYTAKLIIQNTCGKKDSGFITIHVTDTLFPNLITSDYWQGSSDDSLICPGKAINFYFSSGNYPDHTWMWYFGDGDSSNQANSGHSYTTKGNYTVSLVITNKCGKQDSGFFFVRVSDTLQPPPVDPSDFAAYDTIVCPGVNVNFNFYVPWEYSSYKWLFGDGDSSALANCTHSYDTLGTYVAKIIGYNECGLTDTGMITIYITDTIQLDLTNADFYITDTLICPAYQTEFVLVDTAKYSSVKWIYGDSKSDSVFRPKHSFDTAGTYYGSLIAFNKCGKSDTVAFTVHVSDSIVPNLTSSDYYVSDTIICPNIPVTFDLFTSPKYTQHKWYFGDGDSSSAYYINHSFDTLGDYIAKAVVFNSCGNSDTAFFTIHVVNTIPLNIYSYDVFVSEDTVCPGEPVTFILYNTSGYASYFWDFGDGDSSNLPETSHSYAKGNYTAKFIAFNACGKSDTLFFPIGATDTLNPVASINSKFVVCPGDKLELSADGNYQSYEWDFGDTNTDSGKEVAHIYGSFGSFNVRLVVTNYCGKKDTTYRLITADSTGQPDAYFNFTSEQVCIGDTVSFNPKFNGYVSYLWNFGDSSATSSLPNPKHTYTKTGTFNVKLVVTNSCGNKDSFDLGSLEMGGIVVDTSTAPYVNFSFYPNAACANNLVSFINKSSVMDNNFWDFGDGQTSTAASPVHTFTSSGNYSVKLRTTNGCGKSDSVSYTVSVLNSPMVNAGIDTSICMGQSVQIGGTPAASGGTLPYTFSWMPSSDLDFDTLPNPIASPSINQTYKLVVTDSAGCVASDSAVVTVNNYPVAGFTYSNPSGLTVNFTNTSTGASKYNWYFGDTMSDTVTNPVHLYPSNTVPYNCSLVAYNFSCTDTFFSIVNLNSHKTSGRIFRTNYADTVTAGNVYLILYNTTNTSMTFIDTASIAADGSYQFVNVSPDDYLVLADADTLVYPYAARTYFGDSVYWSKAKILNVSSDTAVNISITEVIPTFGPGKINGVVISGPNSKKRMGPGSPVKGVKLSLNSKTSSAPIQFTESADSGKFSFTNIPVGDFYIYADTTGIPVDLSLPTTVFSIDSTDTLFKDVYIYIDSNKVYIIDSSGTSKPKEIMSPLFTVGAVYPVPASDEFYFSVETDRDRQIKISLFDVRGVARLSGKLQDLPKGKSAVRIDCSSLAPGFYLLELSGTDGSLRILRKIAVVKQ